MFTHSLENQTNVLVVFLNRATEYQHVVEEHHDEDIQEVGETLEFINTMNVAGAFVGPNGRTRYS